MSMAKAANPNMFMSENQFMYTRRVLFSGEVDEMGIASVIEKISYLAQVSDDPITLIVDSYGGEPYSSLALADYMVASRVPIHTLTFKAMSAAFIISVCGEKGHRTILKHATMMNHELRATTEGKASELGIEVKEYKRLEVMTNKYIKERTRCPKKIITEWTTQDMYFDSTQCIKYGFADKILESI